MDDNFSPRVKDVITYSKEEAMEKLRQKFPDTHVDFMMDGVDDREFFDEEKDIEL